MMMRDVTEKRVERQAGREVGLTADSVPQMFASNEPVSGYLLQHAGKPGGYRSRVSELHTPMVKSEIMVTLATDLAGSSANAKDARLPRSRWRSESSKEAAPIGVNGQVRESLRGAGAMDYQ